MNELQQHLHRVIARSGLQAADREDVVQETLLRLTRVRARGQAVRNPEAFGTRTALRLVVDRWRDRARRNGSLPADLEQPTDSERPSDERPPEVRALYAAIAKLPPRQAAVITLRKLWELEYREVAELLGISEANCRSHCRHGLNRLRGMLNPEQGAGGANHA